MLGAAWANTIAYATLAVVTVGFSWHVYPIRYEWGRLVRVGVAGAASYVVANRLAPPGVPALAGILLACVVTVGTYAAVLSVTGFFRPVDNLPSVNAVRAGAAVPVKFSLGGDYGLSIFAPGYPRTQIVRCETGFLSDTIENTASAGNTVLSYDSVAGQYTYVWKTDGAWAGSCRELQVMLDDGEVYRARFAMRN